MATAMEVIAPEQDRAVANPSASMERFDRATELATVRPDEAAALFHSLIVDDSLADDEALRLREQAVYALSDLYVATKRPTELAALIRTTRGFLSSISKAKAAKLVRTLLDKFLAVTSATQDAVNLIREFIDWTNEEKRTFLRQALEARLIALYIDTRAYSEAIALSTALLKELKKLDDKPLLVEVLLLDSRTFHALANIPKARAALTSSRTYANAIYVPPVLQAALDLQGGVLHAEEKDFKTAYSYFIEAFEGFDSLNHKEALSALKYMLLSKIMLQSSDEVASILTGKIALKYSGSHVDAMRAVESAHKNRSLEQFQQALVQYKAELTDDPNIRSHLQALYDTLLEQNLQRIIEPFSRVEIKHVADLIQLPVAQVETKLSQMILDKKLIGILDQGLGCLDVFAEQPADRTYNASIDTVQFMGQVVDALYKKAQKLT
ncbi:26S proteasome non-ATPase regulatory subunit 11 [Capsaspora owczarzaki ATCC 30864]|uniref:26S proteasome non-ATPase regulatory subunit 11 n=1 Tax=Capsaspora owczarzaki (strain ATCC 30864) TaxID=595528 RepID=A0A0D2WJU9_CAPO3|nr:26S proteasome non-ATPase regulatory subunit 11 [Capsaspora owczarzaki ATCC 30864]KJE89723.1 26S proteasome non-ATPase regulatory subunit 11 [Capsaspora owczarzaki ATCC 30864]|eukprot:XP_004366025.2 26S proteasome non-ATPase regulatory subunit 11 [Capsaspora owczarzaki ATCC 30864]